MPNCKLCMSSSRQEYAQLARGGESNLIACARRLVRGDDDRWRREKKWGAGVTVDELTAGGEVGPTSTRAESADTHLLQTTLDEPLEKALAALPDALRLTVTLLVWRVLAFSSPKGCKTMPEKGDWHETRLRKTLSPHEKSSFCSRRRLSDGSSTLVCRKSRSSLSGL